MEKHYSRTQERKVPIQFLHIKGCRQVRRVEIPGAEFYHSVYPNVMATEVLGLEKEKPRSRERFRGF